MVKFGKFLEENCLAEWKTYYLQVRHTTTAFTADFVLSQFLSFIRGARRGAYLVLVHDGNGLIAICYTTYTRKCVHSHILRLTSISPDQYKVLKKKIKAIKKNGIVTM